MDPQLPIAFEDYPSFADYEALSFVGTGVVTDLRRVVSRFHLMSGYNLLVGPCNLAITPLNG